MLPCRSIGFRFKSTSQKKLISVWRSLYRFTLYSAISIKWVLALSGWGPPHRAGTIIRRFGTRIRIYVLCWLDMISDCTSARVENYTRRARHTVHMSIAHGHLTCATHLRLHGLCTPYWTRCEKKQKSSVITFARTGQFFLLHKKWNNYWHPYLIRRRTNETWATWEYISVIDSRVSQEGYKLHSLVQSFKFIRLMVWKRKEGEIGNDWAKKRVDWTGEWKWLRRWL